MLPLNLKRVSWIFVHHGWSWQQILNGFSNSFQWSNLLKSAMVKTFAGGTQWFVDGQSATLTRKKGDEREDHWIRAPPKSTKSKFDMERGTQEIDKCDQFHLSSCHPFFCVHESDTFRNHRIPLRQRRVQGAQRLPFIQGLLEASILQRASAVVPSPSTFPNGGPIAPWRTQSHKISMVANPYDLCLTMAMEADGLRPKQGATLWKRWVVATSTRCHLCPGLEIYQEMVGM